MCACADVRACEYDMRACEDNVRACEAGRARTAVGVCEDVRACEDVWMCEDVHAWTCVRARTHRHTQGNIKD